jgi:hypothetical protein
VPTIEASVVPTGGAVLLQFSTSVSGVIVLQRGSGVVYLTDDAGDFLTDDAGNRLTEIAAWTVLYSGAPLATQLQSNGEPFVLPYIDVGDQLPAPLTPTELFIYSLTDENGTAQTEPIQPAVSLNLEIEPLTYILIRLLQAGINSLTPQGFNKQGGKIPQVLHDMPLSGFPPMPFITVTLQLLQQEEIPIGQQVQNTNNQNIWTVTGFAKFAYLVSVLANSTVERDFYRSAVIGIFHGILSGVLSQLGKNVSHRYQASTGQVMEDRTLKIPGFYYSDILLEFTGTFNFAITSSYGIIQTIDFTGYEGGDPVVEVQVPLSGPPVYLTDDFGNILTDDNGIPILAG